MQKSSATKREGGPALQQMSNTMGGFGNSANNLESQIGRGTATSNLNLSIGGGSGSQGQSDQ